MISKNILFIYAHLDDETILSYGTLAKLTKNNNILLVTLCGNGREDDYTKYRAKQYYQIWFFLYLIILFLFMTHHAKLLL